MTGAFTAKNWLFDEAPRQLVLFGDKTRKIESAQHIIEFPGGALEVSRTSDGNYWAHLIINHGQALDDVEGRQSAIGTIVGSRIERTGQGVAQIVRAEEVEHIAILIHPDRRRVRNG